LEGADDDVSGANTASLFVEKQPPQSESVDKKSVEYAGDKTAHNTSSATPVASTGRNTSADCPYVPIPAAGSDLPISPYSCIEQTADDSAVTAEASLRADAVVRPQNAVIEGGEGTKSDGYIPWSSTQPSV